jgi:hypothetical protein
MQSVPTTGPSKGQPAPPTDTPGNYTSDGVEIKDFSKGGRQYLEYHDFLAQPSVSMFGFKYDINKNELSSEFDLKHKFPYKIQPGFTVGSDGKLGVSSNGASVNSAGDVNFFELVGRSTNVTQYAQINKGPQTANIYLGYNLALSVSTSTTIYTYTEKSTFNYMINKSVNLKVTSQTFYNLGALGIIPSGSTTLIDTNYSKKRGAIGVGEGKYKFKFGLE